MSSAPQLSLDERERRAEERLQQLKSGNLSPKSPSMSGSARGAPTQDFSPQRGIPKPGESLFDNYAALQDPTKFSTDEEEVQDLLRMGVGYGQGERSAANEAHLEAGWDPSPHKNPPAYLKLIKVRESSTRHARRALLYLAAIKLWRSAGERLVVTGAHASMHLPLALIQPLPLSSSRSCARAILSPHLVPSPVAHLTRAPLHPSLHRPVPPAPLLALSQPITREPWTIDSAVYNRAFNTADFGKPTRYGVDLFNMGQPVHADEVNVDPRKRPKGVKKQWNAQTFKQTPFSLRGIKPSATATEPWVADQANRAGDFEDNDVIENQTAIELDNGGEQMFKKGAYNAYKNERNRKLHKDAWDGSTRTW